MQMQIMAKSIENHLSDGAEWKMNAFNKKLTCSILECYLAYRHRRLGEQMTMETFLETKVCESSWTNEFHAPLTWNVWIRPPANFRPCYFKVVERSSAGDGAPGPPKTTGHEDVLGAALPAPVAASMVRLSKDHDADHDDTWCLYHLLLIPDRVWGWSDLEKAGGLCGLAAKFGIRTAKR